MDDNIIDQPAIGPPEGRRRDRMKDRIVRFFNLPTSNSAVPPRQVNTSDSSLRRLITPSSRSSPRMAGWTRVEIASSSSFEQDDAPLAPNFPPNNDSSDQPTNGRTRTAHVLIDHAYIQQQQAPKDALQPSLTMTCNALHEKIKQSSTLVLFPKGLPVTLPAPRQSKDSSLTGITRKELYLEYMPRWNISLDDILPLGSCRCGISGCLSNDEAGDIVQNITEDLLLVFLFLFYHRLGSTIRIVLETDAIENPHHFYEALISSNLGERIIGGYESPLKPEGLLDSYTRWFSPPLREREVWNPISSPSADPPFFAEESLGEGANGIVYRVYVPSKCHNFTGGGEYFALKRIFDDRQCLKKLLEHKRHDNINPVLCIVNDKGRFYTLSPLAETSLDKFFEEVSTVYRGRPLNLVQNLVEILLALNEFHGRGDNGPNIHRDIKPANILIFREGERIRWALGDLDGVKQVPIKIDASSSRFSYQHLGRTYAPPEAVNDRHIYCRSDIFPAGACFLEAYIAYRDGPDGCTKFSLQRREQLRNMGQDPAIAQFWYSKDGETALLPSVKDILKELEESDEFAHVGTVLRRMMAVQPTQRMKAGDAAKEIKQLLGYGPPQGLLEAAKDLGTSLNRHRAL